MEKNYKNESLSHDSTKDILFKKDLPPNDFDLDIFVSSTIEFIQFSFSNNQINDEFFQKIDELKEIIHNNQSQFIQILIESEIIQYLFSIYQDENFSMHKFCVLEYLNDFSTFGFSICNIFLQKDFINLFKTDFSNEYQTNLLLIQIYYNILYFTDQQNIIDQILEILSLREFVNLVQSVECEGDILCWMFLCLNEIMKHTIDDINDEDVLYEIIHFYFFNKELHKKGDIKIQNAFARNCLSMLKNRLIFFSLNYELFEKYKLYQFVDYYLIHPPIENFSIACDIISLLIAKYNCKFEFNFESMIDKYLKNKLGKIRFSSLNSIDFMIQQNSSLSDFFFNDECSLLFIFLDSFYEIDSKSKIILFKLIFDLLEIADSDQWICIFENTTMLNIPTDTEEEEQSHISLLLLVSLILGYDKYQLESIKMLTMIFECASKLDYLDQCYQQFDQVFGDELEDLFDLNDENVSIFLQTYFSTS